MRQSTSGRGELLNFLKGKTHDSLEVTKDAQVTASQKSIGGGKSLAVQQTSYQLSGLDGNITDPVIVEEGNKRYEFHNIVQTSPDEAVAERMEVTQL